MAGKTLEQLNEQRARLAKRMDQLTKEIQERETREFVKLAKTYEEALKDAQAAGIEPEKLALAVASLTGSKG